MPTSDGASRQRADIQALRAIAVGSVVLFHLWPSFLPGGYVGVDVFFVISGFLIGSHLISEVATTGRIRLGAFWARRAKRLLPASLSVLLVTAVAVLTLSPAPVQRGFLDKIVAATFYVENWALARDAVDYQASDALTTPTQHFWSLSVEEQFYIGLPLVLLILAWATRRSVVASRRVAPLVVAALTLASFGYAVWLLGTSPDQAYFSTWARAWEFLAGVMLAYLGHRAWSKRRRDLLAWTGIALILLACVVFDGGTSFPGWPALLPVAGALAALMAAAPSLERVGTWRPVAWLGEVSYGVYLWHWPLIILLPEVLERPLNAGDKLGILVATGLLAHLSTRYLEEPIRFSPRLLGPRRHPAVVLAACAAAMLVVAGTALAGTAHLDEVERAEAAKTAQVVSDDGRCLGAQSMDPALAPCQNPALAGVLVPSPATALADDANQPDCWGTHADRTARVCTAVDPVGATRHLLAVGDSHNNTLLAAYRTIGERHRWRIDVSGERGCYLTAMRQFARTAEMARSCVGWVASVTRYARTAGIDGMIVTHLGRAADVTADGRPKPAIVQGLVAAWNRLPDVPIVAIRDNPLSRDDILECVEEAGPDQAGTTCGRPRSEAVVDDGQAAAAAQVPRARVVDLSDLYCTDEFCPAVIGHVLVYRDRSHLTRTWTTTLAPYLGDRLAAALSAAG